MAPHSRPPRIAQASAIPPTPNHPKTQINLLRGWPSRSLLPASKISESASRILSNPSLYEPALEYGPDPGDSRLRHALAAWLHKFYEQGAADESTYERICITGGASQSLGVALATLTDPSQTRRIWLSAPSYFLSFLIFQDAGFADCMTAVREDEDGIDVVELERQIQEVNAQWETQKQPPTPLKPSNIYARIYKHVIYLVPTFSNPSSRTMTLQRRIDLVRLARKYDILIVCDDVYDMLCWPSIAANEKTDAARQWTAPVPRIVDVDRTLDGGPADDFGNVMSNGSFSKICGPGVRTGWVEAAPELAYTLSQAGSSKSGGAPSHLTATFMADLVETGALEKHIREILIPTYSKRYDAVMRAIKEHLVPLGVRLPQADSNVAGGYFLWMELPEQTLGAKVAEQCLVDENLVVAKGELFQVPGDDIDGRPRVPYSHHARICMAWETEDILVEGIIRLAKVIRSLSTTQDTSNGANISEQRDDIDAFK